MRAGEPLLPRADVIAYAASKRKEDAPLTATDTTTLTSSSATASSDGRRQGWVPAANRLGFQLRVPLDWCSEGGAVQSCGVCADFADGVQGVARASKTTQASCLEVLAHEHANLARLWRGAEAERCMRRASWVVADRLDRGVLSAGPRTFANRAGSR